MTSQVPPVKGSAYSFEVSVVSQGDTDTFQTSVTLAAGDVTVHKDGGSAANIDALPTEIGTTGVLTVTLTGSEMNADRVVVRFHDVAGDEWQDVLVIIHTAAQTLDTTDAAVDSNTSAIAALNDLDAAGIRSALGLASANLDAQLAALPTASENADAVLDEALADHDTEDTLGNVLNDLVEEESDTYRFTSSALVQAAQGSPGSGGIEFVYTLTSSVDDAAIVDADVWATSDEDGNVILASGSTDSNGQVTFYLDAGTVYIWRQKNGWNFTNPDTETVS